MRQLLLTLLLTLGFSAQAATPVPVSIVTFNMKWFGVGGGIAGQFGDEFRDPWIIEFSATPAGGGFLDADVLVLQEVVEVGRLKRLLPSHHCQSYATTAPRHQHVVICVKSGYRLDLDGEDDNFALESVTEGSNGLRPAVHGVISDPSGTKRFHIIGVHLKAGPEESEQRLRQVKLIKEFMDQKLTDGLPVVITGDFNSFEEKGDHAAMSAAMSPRVKLVPSERKTYRSFQRARQFDLFFVSPELLINESPVVPEICQPTQSGRLRFDSFDFYQQMVSDHCPVKLVVRWP